MYVQVKMIIRRFLSANEGTVRSMYIDNRGLVTTGIGNLLPSATAANKFQWEKIATGAPALPGEVSAEFDRVKSPDTKTKIPKWQVMGGGNFVDAARKLGIVTLRLTEASLNNIFVDALQGFEASIKATPGFETYDKIPGGFPADAQLGVLSVVWANGPAPLQAGGRLRGFSDLCQAGKWGEIASTEAFKWSNIADDRRRVLKTAFEAAQKVEDARQGNPTMDVTIVSPAFVNLFQL